MSSASCSKLPGQARGQLGGLRQRLLAAPAADHGGAEAGQLQRRLAPEAAAGAGDDADLPVEQTVPKYCECELSAIGAQAYRRPLGVM